MTRIKPLYSAFTHLCKRASFGRSEVRSSSACLSLTLQLSPNSLRLRVRVPSGFMYSLLVRWS